MKITKETKAFFRVGSMHKMAAGIQMRAVNIVRGGKQEPAGGEDEDEDEDELDRVEPAAPAPERLAA